MNTLRWLNDHAQPAIPLPDGRIGIVVGRYVLPVPANVKPLDHFSSEIALREARRKVADALAVGLALGAETVPKPREADYTAAPFVSATVAEEFDAADAEAAPTPAAEFSMPKRRVLGEDDEQPWLAHATGLATEQRGEEW